MLTRTYTLSITFTVAFCSIIYELVFSQLLTVGFGSTVERYSTTIGLFLFSLGLGALFFSRWEGRFTNAKRYVIFAWVELLISLTGILGFLLVLWLSQAHSELFTNWAGQLFALSLCHLPIILVGILSGIEIPLLTSLLGAKTFATILGVDYIGSLAGSVAYGFIFYPKLGLYTTTLVVVTLNVVVLILFLWQIRSEMRYKWRMIFSLLATISVAAFAMLYTIEERIYKEYLRGILRKGHYLYNNPFSPDVKVLSYIKTKYAHVIRYSADLRGKTTMHCVNLDYHVQACDHWVNEYHQGLVDTPIGFFRASEELAVLIVGGGDYIAAKHLLKYSTRIRKIDQVDIDRQFLEYTKNDGFFSQYHEDAYKHPKFNLIVTDGYNYLKNTRNKYDLIIMDLPGLHTDKVAHLYSLEFFKAAQNALGLSGLLISWFYPDYFARKQCEVLTSTLKTAGFQYYIDFHSYIEVKKDGRPELGPIVERYFIISNTRNRNFISNTHHSQLLNEHYSQKLAWQELPNNVSPNGILIPNYDLIIQPHYGEKQNE